MTTTRRSNFAAGLRTTILLASLTGLLVVIGALIGGASMALVFLFMAALMNMGAYFFSDRLALRMSGAKPISEEQAPGLYQMVRELTTRAEMPMPRLCMIPQEQPNAFATGRNPKKSVVAVTQGITRLLSEDELRGVIAHELAHIRNRDVLIQSVAATIGGAITYLGYMLLWFGGDDESPLGQSMCVEDPNRITWSLKRSDVVALANFGAPTGGLAAAGQLRSGVVEPFAVSVLHGFGCLETGDVQRGEPQTENLSCARVLQHNVAGPDGQMEQSLFPHRLKTARDLHRDVACVFHRQLVAAGEVRQVRTANKFADHDLNTLPRGKPLQARYMGMVQLGGPHYLRPHAVQQFDVVQDLGIKLPDDYLLAGPCCPINGSRPLGVQILLDSKIPKTSLLRYKFRNHRLHPRAHDVLCRLNITLANEAASGTHP
jgi:hypothetical protein